MFSCPKSLSAIALVALAGSLSNAQSLSWGSAVDGDWGLATNWDLGNTPDTPIEDAVLGLLAPYTVSTNNNYTIGALSITNPGATLLLDRGQTFTLTKDLFNDGLIVVNDIGSVFDAVLSFGSNATIDGTGSMLLNAGSSTADAQIVSGALTITHNQGHTIMGSGRVSGFMTNHGDIIADQPKGSPLELAGTVDQGATGRIGADGGTVLLAGGSSTTGGELFTVNGGTIETNNSPSISNLVITGDLHVPGAGSFLLINGDIENTGMISINSTNTVFNGHLRFDSDATIDGNGLISLALGGGGDLGDAQLYTSPGITATIGAQQTVSGAGRINGNSGGQLINLGTFIADVPDTELQLQGSISGDGIYHSDNGIIGFGGGLVLDGGTFESSGTGIATHVSNGESNLSNVTNNGEMGVNGNGGFVTLEGPLTNNGTFRINANREVFNGHLRFDASTVIDGTGTIHMVSRGDLRDAQMYTNPGITGTIGGDQAVEGSGVVDGRDGGTIINLGTINGNHAAVDKDPALPLVLAGNHDGGGVGVYRSDDGILDLDGGLVLSGGIFDSSGVGIVTMLGNGVATLSNVTNNGQLGINGNGGFMSLVGPMTNNGTLAINANMDIFNAYLRFDASTHISGPGTIVMRSAGDSNDAQLFTGGVFHGIIGGDQTVMGSGMIDGRDGGTIVNLGTINGNDPDHLLELFGNHGGGGVYRSDNGTLALRSGMVLDGGIFDSSGTGIVEMVGGGTMSMGGVTNIGTMGARGEGGIIELTGPLTNNGTVLINSTQSIFNGHVRFASETVIDGEGVIDMYVNNNFNDAQILNDAGFVGTIGDGQTLTGSGRLQGEMNMLGTIDPGSVFRRFDIDTLHLAPSSHFIADLGGLNADEYDRLLMGGGDSIDLSGTLTVNIDDGYQPQFGDTWDIVSGGTVNGEFDEVNLPDAIALGQVYRVLYTPTRAYVVLTCDADLTGDNMADFFDVSAFLDYFSAHDPRADLDHNGMYDFFDVSVFLDYFGNGCKGE